MIDLDLFVGKHDVRSWLNKPFNLVNETIASNGHTMVAVPKVKGYRSLVQKDKKAAAAVQRLLDFIPPPESLAPLPEPIKVKECDCKGCRGTGKDCVEHALCDGNGCERCEFSGDVETSNPCRYCNGTSTTVTIKLGETAYHIDQKYLNMIKDLPGLKVAVCDKSEKLFWRSGEARGIIMGMRV